MSDFGAQAAHAVAVATAGVAVVYARNTGLAPNVVTTSADINAIVRMMQPDSSSPAQDGLSASAPGQVNQDQRLLIVMAADLAAAGITLPTLRGDTITIPATGETLSVTRADPYKRAFAGAVEIQASAIA